MAGHAFSFGPQYIATTPNNILEPPTITGGVINGATFVSSSYAACRIILRHIRVTNNQTSGQQVALYLGGTGGSVAGTEFIWNFAVVPGNGYLDWYGSFVIDTGDFLTGQCPTSGSYLTIAGEGEIVVSMLSAY